MDHLIWRSQRPPPRVPYLCSEQPRCLTFDQFVQWPDERGWGALDESASPEDDEFITCLAIRCQAWLWFGLLAVVLEDAFHHDAYVRQGEDATAVLDSTTLPFAITEYVTEDRVEFEIDGNCELSHYGSSLAVALSLATQRMEDVIIPALRTWEDANDAVTLWTSPSYATIFSVILLLVKLSNHLYNISRAIRSHLPGPTPFVYETRGISESLRSVGRCPSLVRRLDMTAEQAYLLLSLPTTSESIAHAGCSVDRCTVSNVNESTYTVKHESGCTTACEFQTIDHARLLEIIDAGGIPLVSSEADNHGKVNISLVAGDLHSHYTAISHVWAGGLGNFQQNSLPRCQLKRLHSVVNNAVAGPAERAYWVQQHLIIARALSKPFIRRRRAEPPRKLYWLDTLCVPLRSPEHRKRAIDSMARIYAGAVNVLVLDPTLQKETYTSLTPNELDVLVATSPWMGRSWTLQEGALAVNLLLAFADGIFPFPSPDNGESLLRSAGLQRIWSQDLLAEAHPQRTESLTGYFWEVAMQGLWNLGPIDTSTKDCMHDLEVTRFVTAWNDLATRTTTKSQDVAGILAALLHFSAGEILQLKGDERVQALLKAHYYLPVSLLFHLSPHKSRAGLLELPDSNSVTWKLNEKQGRMKITNTGFVITDSLRLLFCEIDIPDQAVFYLHDVRNDSHVLIRCEEAPHGKSVAKADTRRAFLLDDESTLSSWSKGIVLEVIEDCEHGLSVKLESSLCWRSQAPMECQSSVPTFAAESPSCPTHFIDSGHPMMVLLGKSFCLSDPSLIAFSLSADTKEWPELRWSRLKAFPFIELGLGQEQLVDFLPIITFGVWLFWLMDAVELTLMTFRSRHKSSGLQMMMTSLLPCLLIGLGRYSLSAYEYNLLRRSENRWIQTNWARSYLNATLVGDRPVSVPEQPSPSPQRKQAVEPPRFIIKALVVHTTISALALAGFFALFTPALEHPFPWRRPYLWRSAYRIWIVKSTGVYTAWMPFSISCLALSFEMFLRALTFIAYLVGFARSMKANQQEKHPCIVDQKSKGRRWLLICMRGAHVFFVIGLALSAKTDMGVLIWAWKHGGMGTVVWMITIFSMLFNLYMTWRFLRVSLWPTVKRRINVLRAYFHRRRERDGEIRL